VGRLPGGGVTLRIRVLGAFDISLVAGTTPDVESLPAITDGSGRVPLKRVVRECQLSGHTPVLVLTSGDLVLEGCRWLFGYADRQRQVAVVSTFRLGSVGTERLRARLAHVIAHEEGHLRGLRHCSTPGCLMRPARNAEELDSRGLEPCADCRSPRLRWPAVAAAVLVSVLAIAGLDAVARWLKPKGPPFSWKAEGETAALLFKRQPLLRLRAAGAQPRAQSLVQSLNGLFQQIEPPPFEVVRSGSGQASIRAGGNPLLEVLTGDAGADEPLRFAQAFVGRIEPLIRGKGTVAEGCPDCHIHRIADIEASIRARTGWRE
jgi:hypothetical protein